MELYLISVLWLLIKPQKQFFPSIILKVLSEMFQNFCIFNWNPEILGRWRPSNNKLNWNGLTENVAKMVTFNLPQVQEYSTNGAKIWCSYNTL